jgi:hypothetical protein
VIEASRGRRIAPAFTEIIDAHQADRMIQRQGHDIAAPKQMARRNNPGSIDANVAGCRQGRGSRAGADHPGMP